MKTYEVKFAIGETVLRTDREQVPRLVTSLIIEPTGNKYYLACGELETTHYELEVTKERDALKSLI
jgi:hypothetical protein